jgi:predicted PurR-regulated permease PerM
LKKELNVSPIDVTVSLLGWGFLIGPASAVLSLPFTLALRRFIERARQIRSGRQ